MEKNDIKNIKNALFFPVYKNIDMRNLARYFTFTFSKRNIASSKNITF